MEGIPIAHTPILAPVMIPRSMSLASSITATGTPWEWQAMMIKSALRRCSIQLSKSFHRLSTLSATLPSPSKATFSISQSGLPCASAHRRIPSAQWFAKRSDVPVGCPIMARRYVAGNKPWTPMAMAFLTLGVSVVLKTWFAGGCCVRSRSWVICLMIEGLSFIRYVLLNEGSSRFGGNVLAGDSGVAACFEADGCLLALSCTDSAIDDFDDAACCGVAAPDGIEDSSRSIDCGRPLLVFLPVRAAASPSFALTSLTGLACCFASVSLAVSVLAMSMPGEG